MLKDFFDLLGRGIAGAAGGLWVAIKWTARAIATAATAVGKATLKTALALAPWALGAVALGGPYVLLETVAPDDLAPWSAAYVAGAFGGLILELIRSKWIVELPSHVPKNAPGVEEFAPAGRRIDIGFLGRLTTSAVAAPTFLIIINALNNSALGGVAEQPETLAWAVLLGAVSPMVWKAGEDLVKTRLAMADTELEIQHESLKAALERLEEKTKEARPKAKEAAKQSRTPRKLTVAKATGKAKAKVGGRLDADNEQELEIRDLAFEANGDELAASQAGHAELADALVDYDEAISEAIGALTVATATGRVRQRQRRRR